MHANLHELNRHFGIEDVLHFSAGEGGLWRATVTTDRCVGELYRHGAHLTRWRPAGHDEVLWMSSKANFLYDRAIRGGVPICFPWFAGHQPPGHEQGPNHGYARTTTWEYTDAKQHNAGVTLTMRTAIEPFSLQYEVTFGDTLTMCLEVTNNGSAPVMFESALHTYFVISQIRQVQVFGLEGADYLETAGGGERPEKQGDHPIFFDRETDRLYTSDASVKIIDPGLSRTITIDKAGSGSTVVWNPWDEKARAIGDMGDEEWPGMLCTETANIRPNVVTLQADDTHAMQAVIGVEALTDDS